MSAEQRIVYTVAQASAYLKWSEDTIRREIKDGRLIARRRRSETVILHSDLVAYLEGLARLVDAVFEDSAPPSTPMPIRKASGPQRRAQRRFGIVPQEAI